MKAIKLDKVIPDFFGSTFSKDEPTDVWGKELTFTRGVTYLIEAASGRGKSSLCSFIYGLRSDYAGSIEFIDNEGKALSTTQKDLCGTRRTMLAMMFQEHRIFPELTAVENVLMKNQLTDYFTEKEIRERLTMLGLEQRLDTPCGKLSLGQQQRVAFVRLLAQPADFVILDEPVSHLDAGNARIMGTMLRQRQLADGMGVIVTSIGQRLPYEYDKILKL
ncbi:MAG: ATP-binding cassette domain-containing protein [Bacteroidaceae bacterium]|nr:ATP-binding cassette domain-containing protein [Bacteroidaceae bacterium]